ncbi:hypothetical protein FACS1894202_12400 [Clostridia bacterium]|nr:hypothetical protein FACS1894202_12400 [Clostridia bacterium]
MKVSELVRLVKKRGCKLVRHGSRHDIWINPLTGGKTEIPRHQSEEVPSGMANGILKDLGLK